ncbi:MAG: hypothetical protein SAL07_10240 [Oscillatoria sp. PMC 1051.18]|nr:hypothetical protein [Oscillatoria sp. PMC 1050.18]MEC5030281.1 hypothetical protein [Oscillatoria sp. PMC 1051.18]
MLTTWEMRWFKQGKLPNQVKDWFEEKCPGDRLGSPEERTDLYLSAPGCDNLGIKLRQGNLEVKWRKAELGEKDFGEIAQGKAEEWVKLTCVDDSLESLLTAAVKEKKTWIAVEKQRSQRRYQNCNLEITQVHLEKELWWTIAFETLTEILSLDDFVTTVGDLLSSYPGEKLLAADSFGYAALISQLGTRN